MTELELSRELQRVGCPYGASDYRARLWLEGYSTGFNEGHTRAAEIAIGHFSGASQGQSATQGEEL